MQVIKSVLFFLAAILMALLVVFYTAVILSVVIVVVPLLYLYYRFKGKSGKYSFRRYNSHSSSEGKVIDTDYEVISEKIVEDKENKIN